MAFAINDYVVSAAIKAANVSTSDAFQSIVLNTLPLLGNVVDATTDNVIVAWANGTVSASGVQDESLRYVGPLVTPANNNFMGKSVQRVGSGPTFRGSVLAVLSVELNSVGKAGTPTTDCLLVQTQNGTCLLIPASICQEVDA